MGTEARRENRRASSYVMIDLQPALPDDRQIVFGLARAYFAFDGLAYTPLVESALDEMLANPSLGRVLLARARGAVVGYAILAYGFDPEAGGRIGVLTDLFLAETVRGQGLGREVLDAVLAIARSVGLRQVELWVVDGNARAEALYLSQGFVPVEGRRAMARKIEV